MTVEDAKIILQGDGERWSGAFGGLPLHFWGEDYFVKCPTCLENTGDAWQHLTFSDEDEHADDFAMRLAVKDKTYLIDYMLCGNNECQQLVVRVHQQRLQIKGSPRATTDTVVVYPRATTSRSIDPLIPQQFVRDYQEAMLILDASPRMSAVLSRRILADLLEEFAGRKEYGLADRIDKFISDTSQPRRIRENLHYLRELGDFSAHTKKDDQARIIDVDRVEAEWTLDIIDRLFDYFIVTPERDKRMREAMDRKLGQADRKPIKPLPDDLLKGR